MVLLKATDNIKKKKNLSDRKRFEHNIQIAFWNVKFDFQIRKPRR